MTDERSRHAETIIRNHSMWAVASGAIPVALADLAAVSAVQLDMVRQLCEVYEVDFSATKGKALVSSLSSAVLARVGAASVVKLVPFAGTLVGSVAGGVLSGATAYATGQAFRQHFSTGGTILDLDPDRFKRFYREQFEKGKDVVQQWQAEQRRDGGSADAGAFGEQVSKGRFKVEEMIRRATSSPGSPPPAPAPEASTPMGDKPDEELVVDPTAPVTPADNANPVPRATDELQVDPEAPAVGKSRPAAGDPPDLVGKLTELRVLRDRGLISPEDYEETKVRLLASL